MMHNMKIRLHADELELETGGTGPLAETYFFTEAGSYGIPRGGRIHAKEETYGIPRGGKIYAVEETYGMGL